VSLPGTVVAQLSDGPLTFPRVEQITSGDRLEIDLSLEEARANSKAWGQNGFRSRLLGGTLPGPTVRIGAGDTLVINFENKLKNQTRVNTEPLTFTSPDQTNLHFHGAYVSSESPADDTTLNFGPGDAFQYEVNFPPNHMGGTHWIHPHRHGSGTFQVGGGAAMALIVEDKPGSVPPEVASAGERVMVVQYFNKKDMDEIADESIRDKSTKVKTDRVWKFEPKSEVGDEIHLVNGQYQPELEVDVGPWYRLRVVFASWDKAALDLKCPSQCRCNLLAKDGIYISDYPRDIDVFPIPSGGRADIMLKCFNEGVYEVKSNLADTQYLFKIKARSTDDDNYTSDTTQPLNFDFERPSYQQDLRNSPASEDCSCPTKMGYGDRMNYFSFDPGLYMHRVPLNSVIERRVDGVDSHPYHQHIYPFQLIELGDLSADESKYYKVGDYHDSYFVGSELSEEVTIRYKPGSFTGRMPVHCHRLDHSDKGMLAAEWVDKEGSGCQCGPTYLDSPPNQQQRTDSPLEFKLGKEGVVSCELYEEGEPREAEKEDLCTKKVKKSNQFKKTCLELCNSKLKCDDSPLEFLLDGSEYFCKDIKRKNPLLCQDARVAVHCSKACKMCERTKRPTKRPTRAPIQQDDEYYDEPEPTNKPTRAPIPQDDD